MKWQNSAEGSKIWLMPTWGDWPLRTNEAKTKSDGETSDCNQIRLIPDFESQIEKGKGGNSPRVFRLNRNRD